MRTPALPRCALLAAMLLLGGLLAGGAFAAVEYSVQTLPGLSAGTTAGSAINQSGQVAGFSHVASEQPHAVLWTGGNAVDLGLLQGVESYAFGIDDAGQVVGRIVHASTGNRGFLWTPNTPNGATGIMTYLPGQVGGSHAELAFDINNHGLIAGSSVTSDRAAKLGSSGATGR